MLRKRSSAKRTRTSAKLNAAAKGWITRRRKARERSEAAKRGWVTRRKNERARERKKKRARRPTVAPSKLSLGLREWLVFISYKKRRRGFHADLLMGSDDGDVNNIAPILAEQARRQLPAGLTFLANWIEGGYAMIAKGKPTNRRFTKVRAFQRYK